MVTHKVDPTTLTVIWNSLISISEEMGSALRRTAFSEAVREGEDFSCGVFDREGHLVAQGNFTPGHLGSMPYVVSNVSKYIPPNELEPGDMIVTNDSFIGSGHYPDFYMVAPVFDDNELIGYVVNIAHHLDVGGAVPGSQSIKGVTEAFQEGIRILPVKLIRKGEFDINLLRVILGNVRIPEKVEGDLRAQRNANHVGASRMRSLYRAYGHGTMDRVVTEIFDRSERRTRELISKIPEGTYSFEDFLDDAGPGSDPIRIAVDIHIKGDEANIDFSRSNDQVNAGINCYINFTRAYGMFITKIFANVDVPHNHGVERPIKTIARSGSFFNAQFPAPSSGRAAVQIRIFDAMNGAFAKVLPQRAMGASSHWANPNFSGIDAQTGRRWVMYDLIFGGYGGQYKKDGVEAMCPVFNCGNIPVEVHESNYPALIHRLEFITDSGGAGKHRGGCGIRKDIEILSNTSTVTLLGDRHRFSPYGLFGAANGAVGQTVLIRDGEELPLGSKEECTLQQGDIVSFRLAGAGGYGDPKERRIDRIESDVRNGFVTQPAASKAYPQYRTQQKESPLWVAVDALGA
jgi:N-methylhydantoinase B